MGNRLRVDLHVCRAVVHARCRHIAPCAACEETENPPRAKNVVREENTMALNPIAVAANEAIAADCPQVLEMLGETGKALYFPKGILTQSAEAKQRATRYNATIGIATEGGVPMHLDAVHQSFSDDLSPASSIRMRHPPACLPCALLGQRGSVR